jgi:hypothetical protein
MPLDGTSYHGIDQAKVLAMLLRAKELIREHGWCQDTSRDIEGRYCIFGAIREAGRQSGGWRAWTDLGLPWPAMWQDQPGRTVEEIYAWFDEQITKREYL